MGPTSRAHEGPTVNVDPFVFGDDATIATTAQVMYIAQHYSFYRLGKTGMHKIIAVLALMLPLIASASNANLLPGSWKLVSVNEKPAPKFLSSQVLVFTKDGTVATIDAEKSKAGKKSPLADLITSAFTKGQWSVKDGKLVLSNSSWKGGAPFTITADQLRFERDPYVSDVNVPSKTVYERVRD